MKKITFMNLFLTYSISLSIFLSIILFYYFLAKDRDIFNKIGYFGIILGLIAIILWSLFFSFWSTPRYEKKMQIFYTNSPLDTIDIISNYFEKNGYTYDYSSSNEIILKSSNIITNWFCGKILIKIHSNNISIECSKIILDNLNKLKLF